MAAGGCPFGPRCHLGALLLATVASGCMLGIDKTKGYAVPGVDIRGNHVLADSLIKGQISTHSDNWNLFGKKPLLEDDELPVDARRIQSLYADHGYFDAKVADYGADLRPNGTARVHFRVVEGDGTRVGQITFTGLDKVERIDAEASKRLQEVRDHLAGYVPLKVGGPWSQPDCDAGRVRLRKELRDRGFVYAEVSSETQVYRLAHTAAVAYDVDLGPLARVASVSVTGNRGVTTARILRRVDLRPGDVVDDRSLRRVEANVLDLGAFYSVIAEVDRGDTGGGPPVAHSTAEAAPSPPKPTGRPSEVVVGITVQDMPFHEVRTGVGAGLDNAHSDLHVLAGYQDRNFLGGLRFVALEARPAVVFLPNIFKPDIIAFAMTAGVQFRQPSFLEEYLTLSSRVDYTLDVQYGYRSHGVRANIGLSRKFLRFLRLDLSYNAEVYSFFDVSASLLAANAQTPLGLAFRKLSWLTYLEESLTVDLRDNIFDPRHGFYGLLALDESTTYLGSEFDYLRLLADLRGYVTPARYLTLAFRAVYGQTFPLKGRDMPLPARFMGGGLSDHRGFASNREGPFLCTNPDGSVTPKGTHDRCAGGLAKRVYIGGDVKLLASVEARWYLPANFGLVVFTDVGEVWADTGAFRLRDLNVAVGPGLRYYTSFGSIRADLGVLVTNPSPGAVTFHLSIGQAF